MKKINFTKIIWLLFYIFVFFFLLSNSYKYLDPDLGWHLKVGEQIINEKAVPVYDNYNWTLEGKQWVDHEWLMNVITFWLYKNFGYLTVNIFFTLIALLILIILNIFTQKYFLKEKNGLFFIMLFQILGLIAMAGHLGVRMQEITLLNLLLLLIIIYHYEKNKNYKILFWPLPLFYFWACLHAGFLIGLFLMFFWLTVKLIEIILAKYFKLQNFLFRHSHESGNLGLINEDLNPHSPIKLKNKLHRDDNSEHFAIQAKYKFLNFKNIRMFFCFATLGVLTTFFTPYGLKLYDFLNSMRNTFYMTHIQEWLPFHYFPILYWQILYIAFVATTILLLIIDATKKIKKINLWQILLSLFFIILAFKSKRHFPLLFIVSFPMIVKFFIDQFDFKEIFKKFSCRLFLVKFYLIIAFLLIIASQFLKINFTSDPFLSFNNDYPQKATIFLKNNPRYNHLNFFNPYGWGGYLIWTLPERKLFIDGRLPQYSFKNHTFLEEYLEFFDKEKTENKLKEYNIQLVLLDIKEKKYHFNWFEKYFLGFNEEEINKNANENYLRDYLVNSNEWEKIYNDKISDVYVKK